MCLTYPHQLSVDTIHDFTRYADADQGTSIPLYIMDAANCMHNNKCCTNWMQRKYANYFNHCYLSIIAALYYCSIDFSFNKLWKSPCPTGVANIFFCHHKLPCDAGKKFPSLRIVYNQPHMTTIASIQDSSNGSKHCTRTKSSISAIFYISLCETKIPECLWRNLKEHTRFLFCFPC